jgi:hypothetical protein
MLVVGGWWLVVGGHSYAALTAIYFAGRRFPKTYL